MYLSLKNIVFGLHVPPEGRSFEEMKNMCLAAERLGFDLFTVTDHFMNMGRPDGPNSHPLECWSTLAGLAAVTHKIRLGPLVSCYYYRSPTVLAKMATTIDIISNGRLVFGIGAGWHQQEFKGFMGRFPSVEERMKGLEETVHICRSMFTHERTSFKGKLYHVNNVLNSPLPIQRPPPIMVGGGGLRKTLLIAAKYADISHFAFNPTEEVLNRKLHALKKHCKAEKRDFETIRKGISIRPIIGFTEREIETTLTKAARRRRMAVDEYREELGPFVGTPDQCIEVMSKYIQKGVTFFTLGFPNLEDAKFFTEEIVQKLR